MAFTDRKFGVEIEALGMTTRAAAEAISSAGINCRTEPYGHSLPRQWKVVTDGSLPDNGFEVVSPPLSGEEGLEQVRAVARALANAGARIRKACGLHVHVDANDLTRYDLFNIINRYARFEHEIDKFMPPSRRGSNNTYCTSIKRWLTDNRKRRLFAVSTPRRMASVQNGRYFKINLQCYPRQGTVEFRHHSGTCNAEKITNWIKFCVNFVEVSRVSIDSTAAEAEVVALRESANQRLRSLVEGLIEGGSIRDLACRSGYAPNTVRAMISSRIRAANIEVVRTEGVYRIAQNSVQRAEQEFGVVRPVPQPQPLPPRSRGRPSRERLALEAEYQRQYEAYLRYVASQRTQTRQDSVVDRNAMAMRVIEQMANGDHVFRGLDSDVISFYEERKQELAER